MHASREGGSTKMKILVINCGSSSLKYQLINMENEEVLTKGNYERIVQENRKSSTKSQRSFRIYAKTIITPRIWSYIITR